MRTFLIASLALSFVTHARAQLGGSLEDWKKRFGNAAVMDPSRAEYALSKDGLEVQVHLSPEGKVNFATFLREGESFYAPYQDFTPVQVKRLLDLCAPGRRWKREGKERVASTDGKVVAWFKRPLGMLIVAERHYLFDSHEDFPQEDVRRTEDP
jgi:hypothetical protein